MCAGNEDLLSVILSDNKSKWQLLQLLPVSVQGSDCDEQFTEAENIVNNVTRNK